MSFNALCAEKPRSKGGFFLTKLVARLCFGVGVVGATGTGAVFSRDVANDKLVSLPLSERFRACGVLFDSSTAS